MSENSGYWGIRPWEVLPDDELIPEPDGYRHTFRDGSSITILDDDRAVVEVPNHRITKWTAELVDDYIEENEIHPIDAIKTVQQWQE